MKPEYAVYSLDRRDRNGCLDDGERDEAGDFLTNFEEAHNKMSGPEFWAAVTASLSSGSRTRVTEPDPAWVDPTPADQTDNAALPITRPAEKWAAPAGVLQTLPPEHPLPRTDW